MRTRTAAIQAAVWAVFVLTGGPADALELEQFLMPGPLSQDHADLETDCSSCHKPFEPSEETKRCLDCHEDVASDVANSEGLHGRKPEIEEALCRDCHTEHRGREGDITGFDTETFSHSFTDFELKGRHRGASCIGCHRAEDKYRAAPNRCADCHDADDPHQNQLGDDCAECHDEQDWRRTRFDHADTGFPLEDGHARVDCRTCHVGNRYEDTPADCSGCHAANDIHAGEYGQDCGRCHTPQQWAPSTFRHDQETGFALSHRHAGLACGLCHTGPLDRQKPKTGCADCHAADDVHRGRNGNDCAACHSERAWNAVHFDHARETSFPLRNRHAEIACQQCHQIDPHKEELGTDCKDCHAGSDAHDGTLGADCGECHGEARWNVGVRFDHELTHFPLLGLHTIEPCEACHTSTLFHDTDKDCAACHASADPHESKLGDDCGRCHNPNGWAIWRFDHNRDTDFPLRGGHAGLNCLACHTRGTKGEVDQPSDCASCHAFDDTHRGGFGRDCGQCHREDSWSAAQIRAR